MVLRQVREDERVEADAVEPVQRAPVRRCLERHRVVAALEHLGEEALEVDRLRRRVRRGPRAAPPTTHSTVPTSPVRRPAASRIERSRNAVVVLPFVPVTPATSSRVVGSPKKTSAATAIAARAVLDDQLRHRDVDGALDDERDCPSRDGLGGEVVPVRPAAADAEEERTVLDLRAS